MFVWILILIPWVVLLSLILHDATKEDRDGSAISIAAKNFKAFIFWALQKIFWALRKIVSKSRANIATAGRAISSSSEPSGPREMKQASAVLSKKMWWRKEHRVSITIPELELTISEAVKKSSPGCEDFGGVIVRHETPKSHLDPNWAIRGVKFGKADRKGANEALASVVERMQREFLLSDE
jgi:hypothetical protein